MRWGLEFTPVADSTDVTWSLDEAVAVLHRLYQVAHDPRYTALHQRRWFEKSRRIGVSNSVTDGSGARRWHDFTAAGRMPSARASKQQPFLPAAGYTPEALTSVKPSVGPVDLFLPALLELLTNAGFGVGVRECVHDALAAPNTRQLAQTAATPELEAGRGVEAP